LTAETLNPAGPGVGFPAPNYYAEEVLRLEQLIARELPGWKVAADR